MLLSYNCKLKELETKRRAQLKEKKEDLDILMNCRMPLDETESEHVAALKRQITHFLDSKEIIQFLLDAQPFLWKYQQLEELPPHQTFRDRLELHEEFMEKFKMIRQSAPEATERKHINRIKEERFRFQQDSNLCKNCGIRGRIIDDRVTASLICSYCGVSEMYSIPEGLAGLTYEEKMRVGSPPYTYKPEQHFTDLLNQVQGKTRRPIPTTLIMQLQLECRKRGIETSAITPQMIRLVLRDIRKTAYYDEICAIAHHLNPAYQLVLIKEEDQALLKALFREVYGRFPEAKAHINPLRKNFMSYPHLAHVLCDFMGFSSYTKEFTWLKNRDKRKAHDEMLKWIFRAIGWQFRNTV